MNIADIMRPNGKIYLRPEFGRIGKQWPCIAFRLTFELEKLVDVYQEGNLVLGTGTVNGENTREPTYRGKILTVATIKPQYFPTQEIVPPARWARHCQEHGGEAQWPHCLPALRIFNVGKEQSPYPKAKSFMPVTYPALSRAVKTGRAPGGALLITPDEQRNLMKLPLIEVPV